MLAVEKIGGVFGIGLERNKARKRSKRSFGPFPPIADKLVDAPRAYSLRPGPYRCRRPAAKIKIAVIRTRLVFAPGKGNFTSVRCAAGSTRIFRFGGEPPPLPSRVGLRFSQAYIDRPVGNRGQRQQIKQSAIAPLAAASQPKVRMTHALPQLPCPVSSTPIIGILVRTAV